MNSKEKNSQSTTKNKNDININNNFSLSINFGDSLNLLALIAGIFIIKRISKQYKINKKWLKENKRNE
ncbi:hypothetical protein F7731_24795 [Cytobacillus depressus]|uniref:Uncharacterized protein n=1 Tax=Cytobacillus depressus TaxID=1602942 RepID=A0A6L3UX64_9BACI|nr:hypothetical protein [Cytobacillus depressus]KAB2328644.1 hypothetical protein F7731_24795 [Cytobacillus depressus]